jgi:hypothetical protein
MRKNKLFHLIFFKVLMICWLINGLQVFAQSSEILDSYIKLVFENNLALQHKELDLEKSLRALKEANGLFYPSVGLEAQYFLSEGGRSIELPLRGINRLLHLLIKENRNILHICYRNSEVLHCWQVGQAGVKAVEKRKVFYYLIWNK